MERNYIVSSLFAPHGIFIEVPEPIQTSVGVVIKFELEKQNLIKLMFFFDKSKFTKEEAEDYSARKSKQIALKLSLENSIYFEVDSNVSSSWVIDEANGRSSNQVSISVKASVAGVLKVKLKPDDIQFHYSENFVLVDAVNFFNKALFYREQSYKDHEIALWLFMSWEAIQLSYNMSEQKLKNLITRNKIHSSQHLRDFKYSIGLYYRHFKGQGKKENKAVLTINECIGTMQKILKDLCE